MKRVAIYSGGDWYDASCHLLNIPDDVDIDLAEEEYRIWKQENRLVAHDWKFLNFADWLRTFKNGTDSDVIEVWEEL